MYRHREFAYYAAACGGWIILLWFFVQFVVRLSRYDSHLYRTKYFRFHQFAIATLSGTMGAQNILFAKGASTLLVLTVTNKGMMFTHYPTYLILVGLFWSIYFQLRWLNSGLKRHFCLCIFYFCVMCVFVIGTYTNISFWILVSVMGGLAVYQEFNDMDTLTKFVFPIGVLMTVGGVSYLTAQKQPKTNKQVSQKDNVICHADIHINANASVNADVDIAIESSSPSLSSIKETSQHCNGNVDATCFNQVVLDGVTTIEDNPPHFEVAACHVDSRFAGHISVQEKTLEHDAIQYAVEKREAEKILAMPFRPTDSDKLEEDHHRRLPSAIAIVAKTFEYGEAAMVTGSSLGRLLIQPDELLKDSSLGIDESIVDCRDDNQSSKAFHASYFDIHVCLFVCFIFIGLYWNLGNFLTYNNKPKKLLFRVEDNKKSTKKDSGRSSSTSPLLGSARQKWWDIFTLPSNDKGNINHKNCNENINNTHSTSNSIIQQDILISQSFSLG
ncbi:hypothetical protein RFI_32051 [Reticulomyxa filosa]|uniref:Magnesium transporter n=1 Tax=Reticulomyxa filosa TaxID=46433 RepID=X6LW32_RETFI|nr:hypothetical protein RFI_32051 [Reticulomyxa filosa]|eukprot:ETO05347.1 hypothetical protein RFI_32051 [Reticulomyxa filosa]